MKVNDVDPNAFWPSHDRLEEFGISAIGRVDAVNPIHRFFTSTLNCTIFMKLMFSFPFQILKLMPNLKYFRLQMTMINDASFDANFSEMSLPELKSFAIAGGKLTRVPKMFTAPKLTNIRFAYHPLDFITPFAFANLPSLEQLDLSGNAANPTLDVLKPNTLTFSSQNFTRLGIIKIFKNLVLIV